MTVSIVIPAEAGTQYSIDSRLRGNDRIRGYLPPKIAFLIFWRILFRTTINMLFFIPFDAAVV
ncbi:MAG: hypothetical protein UT41_C0001G0119 [Candidatus Wolfebacteria bacterium GW2011_GWC2_39_22]|uniref:Uncharacterized protein n=1 Tax=Candidatus Wolfebacteria bacterium GW2011_GWC2_39_22 TaxID=1619013 RepID=A0A0G0QQ95_9BACT|nr:MAG: hypothetical protein UT41_C0001G0119 [Candidatus Wolfebacteria bacterium GW2011_GWC2_39_22]HBI25776.1 hypothetical protein [Candidatus Wolfebacteria bacterium]